MRRRPSFLRDTSGATAIEYALIAALIGLGLITSLGSLRGGLNSVFGTVAAALSSPGPETPPPPPAAAAAASR